MHDYHAECSTFRAQCGWEEGGQGRRLRRRDVGLILTITAITASYVLFYLRLNPFSSEGNVHCPQSTTFRELMAAHPTTLAPFPTVVIFSFEGSGNTWMRSLFEDTTGKLSNAVLVAVFSLFRSCCAQVVPGCDINFPPNEGQVSPYGIKQKCEACEPAGVIRATD